MAAAEQAGREPSKSASMVTAGCAVALTGSPSSSSVWLAATGQKAARDLPGRRGRSRAGGMRSTVASVSTTSTEQGSGNRDEAGLITGLALLAAKERLRGYAL